MTEYLDREYARIKSNEAAIRDLSYILFGETGRQATEVVAKVKEIVEESVGAYIEEDEPIKSTRPMTLREIAEKNRQVLDTELRRAIINATDAGYRRLTLIFAEMLNLLQDATETYPLNEGWKENNDIKT